MALASGRGGAYYREHLADNALDPRVVALTDDSGVLVYRPVAQRAGKAPYSAVISSTFVRRDGACKLAFHQQSPT
jgi:hypothetical protein